MIAMALVVPAIPFSEITSAYAEPGPLNDRTANIIGSNVGDEGIAADPFIGAHSSEDRWGPFPGDASISERVGGASSFCGNCLEGYDDAVKEEEERNAKAEKRLEEALAKAREDSPEVALVAQSMATEIEAETAIEAEAETAPIEADRSLTDGEIIVRQPYSQGADDADDRGVIDQGSTEVASRSSYCTADYAAEAPSSDAGYSSGITLKDIESLGVYAVSDSGAVERKDSLWIGAFDPKGLLAYVKPYRMPPFYAEIASGYTKGEGSSREFVLKLRLPTSKGEEPKYADMVYGQAPKSYAYESFARVVTDTDILSSLASVPGYDPSRSIAYINAYKLAPFASFADIVRSGNAIPQDSDLAMKTIRENWPVHESEGMRVSLFEGEESRIVRNMVCFTDNTSCTFDLSYQGTSQLAASYLIDGMGVLYQPNLWVLGEQASPGIERMASFIRSKTWNTYFKSFCQNAGVEFHRTVRDYFDVDIKAKAEEVAANLVSNIDEWSATATDSAVWRAMMDKAEMALPSNQYGSTEVELKMFNLLFLYTYFDRFYGFDYGGSERVGAQRNANGFLVMAFRGDAIKSGLSLAQMTCDVKSSKLYTYSLVDKTSTGVFHASLSKLTGAQDVPSFIELLVARTTGYTDPADWFADYMSSIAFYHEYEPPCIEGASDAGQLTWRGWHQAKRYPNNILLWMRLKPGSQYFAATSMLLATGSTGVYAEDNPLDEAHRRTFEERIDGIFEPAARYAATVASIVGAQQPNKICIVSFDHKVSKIDGGTAFMESEKLWGKKLTVDDYHKNFSDPSELYNGKAQGAAAMTLNMSISVKRIFFFQSALSSSWSYVWSHEVAHALDNDVFLGGSRRAGTEDYTDGVLTQSLGSSSYVMNLCNDYALSADISTNLTRERIGSKEKLDDYYHKMYEVLDILDYAALKAFLDLSKDEQNAVASQAWFDGQNGASPLDTGATAVTLYSRKAILEGYQGTDATTPMNSSRFIDGERKFETPEEVYDNQVFLRPGIANAGKVVWLWQGYVSDDIRGVWWHPIHCNGVYPDSRSFKLEMYRMLGDRGYDAWADFGRKGTGDLGKLRSLTGYSSFKEWQMAKWDAIEKNKDDLSYVAFDSLVDKFEAALKQDAHNDDRALTQMSSLRTRMYYMMKRITDDFRYGIYDDQTPVIYIHDLGELQAIADNPYGNYALANDIDASGFSGDVSEALVDGTFYGKLDGRGHEIYSEGRLLPYVFATMKNAYIKDVTLTGGSVRAPSRSASNGEWENISYELFAKDIRTVEDLANIGQDLERGINRFVLKSDLDLSDWSSSHEDASVVSCLVSGTASQHRELDGGGHRISGLHGASLFDKVAYLDVHDLFIERSSNMQDAGSGDRVALVARQAYRSKFSDICFDDVSLQGRYRLGFVVAEDGFIDSAGQDKREAGSQFSRIQVMNGRIINGSASVVNACCYAGFIAGRVYNSDLEDIYVQGTLTSFGTSCGGVIGAITNSARLDRCVSNVDLERAFPKAPFKNGCVIGDIESAGYDANRTRVAACFGLGSPTSWWGNPGARLAEMSAAATDAFENCFENAVHGYGRSLYFRNPSGVRWAKTGDVVLARDNNGNKYTYPDEILDLRNNKGLYASLGFDEEVWTFEPSIQSGYPVLRITDPASATYDLDCAIDYENEVLRFTGADFDPATTKLRNLPYRLMNPPVGSGWEPGMWFDTNLDTPIITITGDSMKTDVDLSEIIEYEGFENLEVEEKGTRSIVCSRSAADSGKIYAFAKSIELPPRQENAYADEIVGVDADSKGVGAIHIAAELLENGASFEYRPADDGTSSWTPIASTATSVPPGTYEVRTASSKRAFASYPSTVTIREYDPSAKVFSLVLDADGGTWAQGYEAPIEYDNERPTPLPGGDVLSREGFVFRGWYADPSFSGSAITEIPAHTAEPLTFYARWEASRYAVTLNFNGGRLEDSRGNVTEYAHGQKTALPVPVREHRAFAGWFDNEACTGAPVESIAATELGDKEFWAKWEKIAYTVTLHPGEGRFVDGASASFTYDLGEGTVLPTAAAITRMGYTFVGWFDNEACTGTAIDAIGESDSGDKELWAKWSADAYEVVLAKNHGVLAAGERDIESYEYGMGAILPELERAGYEFDGWYADAAFSGSPVASIGSTETGTKEFWAKWSPRTYAITYDRGADENGDMPSSDLDLSAFESYTVGTAFALPSAETMVWPGHVFAGWYDNVRFEGHPITEISLESWGDRHLYARWAGEACVIAYHSNEGVFGTYPKTIFEVGVDGLRPGDAIALPVAADIERNGYVFEGWYADGSFSGPVLESVSFAEGNIEVFAKWKAVEYAISFELSGGAWKSGYEPPVRYTIESEDVILPLPEEVVREGHDFKGWHEDASLAGEVALLIQGGSTGDRTFFASWQNSEPAPAEPGIVSVALPSTDHVAIAWNEEGYSRMEVPRSKMPATPEDLDIKVSNGAYVHSVTKREQAASRGLIGVLASLEATAGESVIWDIVLKSRFDSNWEKSYTLELVPLDEGGDGDPPVAPVKPDDPAVTPTPGDGDDGQSEGNGGQEGGDQSGGGQGANGSGIEGSVGLDGSDDGGSDGGDMGDGPEGASEGGNGASTLGQGAANVKVSDRSAKGSVLTRTGDPSSPLFGIAASAVILSAAIILIIRRRASKASKGAPKGRIS